VLWFDSRGHAHILYRCHGFDGGIHLISNEPESVLGWRPAPAVAESVSCRQAHGGPGPGSGNKQRHLGRILPQRLSLYGREISSCCLCLSGRAEAAESPL
jgi:hypothetical protein